MIPHTEKSCQICAVSFNIGRVRTIHEPVSSGWDPTGSPYHHRDATSSLCSRYPSESGCQNVVVETPPDVHAESRYQHLAGPGCTFKGGYNGNRISETEMRGSNRVRYILREPVDVGVEGGKSEFFVSAETIDTPIERGSGTLREELYGVNSFVGQNYPMSGYRGEDDVAIPVHDACWKIFERVSMKKLGRVDLDGFVALWWREACGGCGFKGLNQDSVLRDLKEKWWMHRTGTEYLAANPVAIPGFHLAMRGVYAETPRGDGAFMTRASSGMPPRRNAVMRRHQNSTDPFNELPTELKNKVLEKLSPKEIANLRLSSRSFRQLPKQIFKQLIEEELPWFWEVDEIRDEIETQYQEDFKEQYGDDLDLLQGIIPPAWFAFVKERMDKIPMDINWLQVYKQLKVLERGSLGLRNRVRIWGVAEEVVAMIEGMRNGLDTSGGFVVYPKEMTKDGDEKDHSCCPGCVNVQIELEDEDEDDEDIFEKSSAEDNSGGSSEGYVSEDASSSEEEAED
ncbi:hypothetical protein VTL71DRAFT_484 [Oculimacula yallundae]|uniref:F-box domain-containing protein n=1 Tax=Oculimacula yallundae TaxID=86028 RepID=A0ABR4D2G2_9HELO